MASTSEHERQYVSHERDEILRAVPLIDFKEKINALATDTT